MTDTTTTTTTAPAPGENTTGTPPPPPGTTSGPGLDTAAGAALDVSAHPPSAADEDTATTDSEPDDVAVWKSRAREWEQRSKRNAELAARSPDLEARARSLEERYEEAVGTRARLEAELWRERAARAHGVPDDLFEFLTGSSEDEVMERAERIAARVTGPRRPLPDPTQWRGTSAPASPDDALRSYVRERLHR